MPDFIPPLSVYFVWHPADSPTIKPIMDYCAAQLQRDVKRPFSRAMNLPVFYRTTVQKGVPLAVDLRSDKTIIFPFLGKEVLADDEWVAYVEALPASDQCHIIPIAIDKYGLSLTGPLAKTNCIRAYNFPMAYFKEYAFISIAHEIFRYSLNDFFMPLALGKDNSLKIFLSHAKDGAYGIKLATALKSFIDNTAMRDFFDATDIAPGYMFDKEILDHIKGSSVVAIHSDPYSSRYWCQREIMTAKELDRPIIAVDCLEEFEDRRFPFASNIPGVHVHPEGDVSQKDLLRILSATLLETIRFFYSKLVLGRYKSVGWVDPDAEIRSRPPEVSDIEKILLHDCGTITCRHKIIVYPEPPVYSEELKFLSNLGIKLDTPLSFNSHDLKDKAIGISISQPSEEELVSIGLSGSHLVQLAQDFARHLLARGSSLIYGGDLRDDGFTQFLFDEAQSLQARLQTQNVSVQNFIAWPLYTNDSVDAKAWKAKYRSVAAMIACPPPAEILDLVPSADVFLPPSNAQNHFVWSRSLTEMRREMVSKCNARICVGGTHSGYKGKMPGILEEVMLSLAMGQPVYLLGGFGGVTASLCKYILTKNIPDELTLEWQIENNPGYREFINFSVGRGKDFYPDHNALNDIIIGIDLKNGLSDEDNKRLFSTPFMDEAIWLVLKGLKAIDQMVP